MCKQHSVVSFICKACGSTHTAPWLMRGDLVFCHVTRRKVRVPKDAKIVKEPLIPKAVSMSTDGIVPLKRRSSPLMRRPCIRPGMKAVGRIRMVI